MSNTAKSDILESGDIKVSKKTLLHVSEGIYRSVGSALKEVVNNSFDAEASTVNITTNFPSYDFLSIQDDGIGMELSEFKRIVEGGIGDSSKSTQESKNRPLIGKLGIGILAIAQVCRSFTIISHHKKSRTAFKGKMIFNPSVDKVAKTSEIGTTSGYPAGKWELIEKLDYDNSKKGVLIYTDDLRLAYLERFRKDGEKQNRNDAPLRFEDYFENVLEQKLKLGEFKSIKELGAYHEFIYELCTLLPIKYLDKGPVRNNIYNSIDWVDNGCKSFIESKQKELSNFNFSVILDGINLYKPIKLPFPELRYGKSQSCQIFYLHYDKKVRGRRLKFSGYIFAQEHSIYPREINGLQIRIKNVGIGLHDLSFLGYDKVESPRDKWLTGEIYVEDGLESALNIDRDSFNENDEHYFILRREVHCKLREEVFPYIRRIQNNRNKLKRQNKKSSAVKEKKKNIEILIDHNLNGVKVHYSDSDGISFNPKLKRIEFPKKFLDTNPKVRRDTYLNNLFSIIQVMEKVSDSDVKKTIIKLSKIVLS